jgi:glyoxylase-like metal-dependent hydrolase (beta-lactamase superfamily II)
LLEVYPGLAPRSYPLDIRELAQERIMFDHWTIETVLTGHTNTSIGYRVEAENKVVVYSGDAVAKPELNTWHATQTCSCVSVHFRAVIQLTII